MNTKDTTFVDNNYKERREVAMALTSFFPFTINQTLTALQKEQDSPVRPHTLRYLHRPIARLIVNANRRACLGLGRHKRTFQRDVIMPFTQQTSPIDQQQSKHPPWPYVGQQSTQPVHPHYQNVPNTNITQVPAYMSRNMPSQAMHSNPSQSFPTHPSNQVPLAYYEVREGNVSHFPAPVQIQRPDHTLAVPANSDYSNALISVGPPMVPTVKDMVESVLSPTHQLLSQAWRETASRVQGELQNVHSKYTELLRYEKNITEQAVETCKTLRAEADAAQAAQARAEAERNEALAEVGRLKEQNETFRKKVVNIVQNGALKNQISVLMLERQHLRKEWHESRMLRLQLQQENIELKQQLRNRSDVGLSVSSYAADRNGVAKELAGPLDGKVDLLFPFTKHSTASSSRSEFVLPFLEGPIDPPATDAEADELQELLYPSTSEESFDLSSETPIPSNIKAKPESSPLPVDNVTTSTCLAEMDGHDDKRPLKRPRLLSDDQS